MPGDGLKSVPIVTFFNDPYLFNGWTDLVHFWYAYVKLDADSEFYIFKFLSLFVCLLRGVTRSVPCQALMYFFFFYYHKCIFEICAEKSRVAKRKFEEMY